MADLLADRYELTALIGRGPTGTVWRAQELRTRERLAVKILDRELTADRHIVDRFARERPVLTAFLHKAYVRVRDLIAEEGTVALVMEYVPGSDLRATLDPAQPWAPAPAVRIALGVAEALAAAHDAGVVHCDLKPSNLLIEERTGDVRLTDSRVGRLVRGYRQDAGRFATPEYAAPEVILDSPPVSATDVYALGLVLYEMLTGLMPYRDGDPDAALSRRPRAHLIVPPGVAPELRHVIEACTGAEPATRPGAAAVADELRRVLPALAALPAAGPATRDATIAFVRYWFDLLNHAVGTGDTAP
ncbi:MAG: hypothetical protein AUI14_09140, partial [Actinobacteria bacterium 13_2_20CM_2_71_6]